MKNNKVKSADHVEDSKSSRTRIRFGNSKWKFASRGSKKRINTSATVESGLASIFTKASQHQEKSAVESAINNSFSSLGLAVTNSSTRDIYQVIDTIYVATYSYVK